MVLPFVSASPELKASDNGPEIPVQGKRGSINGRSVIAHGCAPLHPGRLDASGCQVPPDKKSIHHRSFRHIPWLGIGKVIRANISDLFKSAKYVSNVKTISRAIDNKGQDVAPGTVEELKKTCSDRALEIINQCRPGSCLVIDFSDGRHSAMILYPTDGEPRYFSFGAGCFKWKKISNNLGWKIDRHSNESDHQFDLRERLIKDMVDHYDCIDDQRMTLVTGLDSQKMMKKAVKIFENSEYSNFFNCATFVADVLKSGYQHIHRPLINNRRLQTPENTQKLAREIQYKIDNRPAKSHGDGKLEQDIDQCRTLDRITRVHQTNVVNVKSTLRFRLKHFLLSLVGIKSGEEYQVNQIEKYIARHIMGSDGIKNALIKELKNDQDNDQRIKELLSLLRLDSASIERVVKLNDPALLEFYLNYFGEDVNRIINKRRETMLLSAIRNQSNNIVRALWDRADRSCYDKDGNTVLILAAKKGNKEVVNMCLPANPDISEIDKYGKTALDKARKYHHLDAVRLLQQRGVMAAGISK